ncbi:MAG: bifunctional folylpolyglutamate synthase/dihydrofolate synthase, partial [Bacteroidetes bacterium]|nr:bifunctional folylpolyglutamate synthase/dihydrofolate synthase [Fibrella sp.]
MEYAQAVAYLYERLPVFHRIGARALKPGLGNTEVLCAALGDPHRRFRSIHVAGTNGKGSTAHMLASVYQAAGYRVGLYTSPHLKSFTERIRINGQPIVDEAVAAFVTQHQLLIELTEPSFFEVTVALAFDYFAREAVDLAIIEVGLGGRLDSTNVITPLLSVITNIGFDHTDILGNTLTDIAAEKAGIIKAGVPVLIGETQSEIAGVFTDKASDCQSTIQFADQLFALADQGLRRGRREVVVVDRAAESGGLSGGYSLDLAGAYQLRNLPVV